jgi:WD40 repeat protein
VCHTELQRWTVPERLRVGDYSADGKRLAFASDTHLLLLDAHTGRTERRVALPPGVRRVRWLRFLGNASLVLTAADVSGAPAGGTRDPQAPVHTRLDGWEVSTGRHVWTHRENDQLADCALSRQGDVLVVIFRREALRLLNARTGRPLAGSKTLRHQLEGPTVDVSADGKTFAVGSWGRGVSVRRVPDGQVRWSRNLGIVDVSTVALSTDGSLLAVGLRGYGSNFGRCMVYGGSAAQAAFQLPGVAKPMRALAFSGDGKHLVGACEDRSLLVWKLKGARLLRRVVGPGAISDMALAADTLAAATVGEDHAAALWDLSRDQDAVRIDPFPLPPTAAAFGPDGSWFVDSTLVIRRSDTGAITARLGDLRSGPRSTPFDLTVSADGNLIAAGGQKSEISLWRRETPEQKPVVIPAARAGQGQGDFPPRVAFGPGGSLLAASGRGVRLWDASSPDPGATERTLPGCDEKTYSVCFSPDGSHLAASVGTEGLRIWRLDGEHPRLVHSIPVNEKGNSIGPLIFSPNGRLVLAAVTGPKFAVMVVDTRTGRTMRVLDGGEKGVSGLACTPDGRRLALAGNDGVIRFLDISTWQEVFRLDAYDPLVLLKIGPKGQHLLAATWMGRIMLWQAPISEPSSAPASTP